VEERWAELQKKLAEARPVPETRVVEEFRDKSNTLTPAMVRIDPSGGFLMGASTADDGARTNEKPYHPVAFARSFALGVCPVTVGEWNFAVDNKFGAKRAVGPDSLPMTDVSWDLARGYTNWLSRFTGFLYRLPSEAEWEYACRARTNTKYYFGDEIEYGQANFNATYLKHGNSAVAVGLVPAKSYMPNAFGLYNMQGMSGSGWRTITTLPTQTRRTTDRPGLTTQSGGSTASCVEGALRAGLTSCDLHGGLRRHALPRSRRR
jgi:formylglycine-generating enzyme required for sulfatase activity